MRSLRSVVSAAALLIVAAAPMPAIAGEDDLHSKIVAMLEAEISEEIILEWLTGESDVPRPTADELVALKGAGATDRLLSALVSGKSTAETPAESSPRADSLAASGASIVEFELSYKPPKVDDDDELWDLFVYLDGEPLAYVPPSGNLLVDAKSIEFRRSLLPGPHTLRVALEKHERRGRNRWHHRALVAVDHLVFELSAGADARVEAHYDEGLLESAPGPLTLRFVEGDRVIELEDAGGNPMLWPELCEEIEADSAADGGEAAELAGCVRWSELWEGTEPPSRDAVREALAAFEFRPVPRGS